MRNKAPALLVFGLLAAALPGQEGQASPFDTAPAKQLAKFDILLGTFDGSGTAAGEAGGAPMPWTARTTVTKVLGGHFYLERMVIKVGEGMNDLVYQNLYGWDRERQRYGAWGISNQGSADATEVHWEGNTMITVQASVMDGTPFVERWIIGYGKDGYSVVGERAAGTGPWEVSVKGQFKKGADDGQAFDTGSAFMASPAITENMAKLKPMCGTYRMTGSMVMMPGDPEMKIAGSETISLVHGGTVCAMKIAGDPVEGMPGAYEGWSVLAWNEHDGCYKMLWADNMGMVGTGNAWLRDGQMITTWEGVQMGQPVIERSIVKLDDDGAISEVIGHRIMANRDPECHFKGRYERKQ